MSIACILRGVLAAIQPLVQVALKETCVPVRLVEVDGGAEGMVMVAGGTAHLCESMV